MDTARRRRGKRGRPLSRAASRGPKSDINITPLIDVMLVLLIIFMVVTPPPRRVST